MEILKLIATEWLIINKDIVSNIKGVHILYMRISIKLLLLKQSYLIDFKYEFIKYIITGPISKR